jgi:RimJ/RimL family protein N-acetyltransferase
MSTQFQSRRGRIITLRSAFSTDILPIALLFTQLSAQTLWLRFMTPMPPLASKEAWYRAKALLQAPSSPYLLLATIPQDGEDSSNQTVVALAELWPSDSPHAAEIALLVRDDFQREGLGTHMALKLGELALAQGYQYLHFDMWTENKAVQRLLFNLKVPHLSQSQAGQVQGSINLV